MQKLFSVLALLILSTDSFASASGGVDAGHAMSKLTGTYAGKTGSAFQTSCTLKVESPAPEMMTFSIAEEGGGGSIEITTTLAKVEGALNARDIHNQWHFTQKAPDSKSVYDFYDARLNSHLLDNGDLNFVTITPAGAPQFMQSSGPAARMCVQLKKVEGI